MSVAMRTAAISKDVPATAVPGLPSVNYTINEHSLNKEVFVVAYFTYLQEHLIL